MPTKALKLQIVWPSDREEANKLSENLRNAEYWQWRILNNTMNWLYADLVRSLSIKKEIGHIPPDRLSKKEIYHSARRIAPELSAGTVAYLTEKVASARFKNDIKAGLLKGQRTLTNYRRNCGIYCRAADYTLKLDNKQLTLSLPLWSKVHEGPGRIQVLLGIRHIDGSRWIILNRLLEKEYKQGAIHIQYYKRKKKWMVIIPYSFDKKQTSLDPDIQIGVDLGITYSIAAAVSNGKDRLMLKGADIETFRRRIRHRRRDLQSNYRGGARHGKGRVYALKPIAKLAEKEKNFRGTRYHQYSKALIDFALKHNAGAIVLEDLSSLKQAKTGLRYLGNWCPSDLQSKIKYKAEEQGIKVIEIAPQYTSQRCSNCGLISRDMREGGSFKCIACGYEAQADYNAARNIAIPGIEEIIARTLGNHKKAVGSQKS